MYICVSTIKSVKPGEIVVLKKDLEFDEISAMQVGGELIGFVTHNQPEGCLKSDIALRNIKNKNIIAQVALVAGDVAVLYSQSTALLSTSNDFGRLNLIYA